MDIKYRSIDSHNVKIIILDEEGNETDIVARVVTVEGDNGDN